VICGTGIGVAIAANKLKGIRCALCTNATMAKLAKEHNDANILALGERIIGIEFAKDIVDAFLQAKFQSGRHCKRIRKIDIIEQEYRLEGGSKDG
jgi:ribose 5-phosphate isomerase B